jgi:hypothetical protein
MPGNTYHLVAGCRVADPQGGDAGGLGASDTYPEDIDGGDPRR